uniref:ABM domain-containing protein n=1 Tax=Bionectria ochroleuca TaxID=29856 RepID=A0A8H7K709_BIOOC
MVVTELLFVSYNLDPKLQEELKQKAPELFTHFLGVNGLQSLSRGKIVADNGTSVDSGSGRSALVLEWDNKSSFHDFFPNSPAFQAFAGTMKPFVSSPVLPELYESPDSSTSGASANITQIIKVAQGSNTEKVWGQITKTISQSQTETPHFFHGSGIEEQQGNFLGLIGWPSLKSYEESRKHATLVKLIDELSAGGKLYDVAVDLASIPISK